MGLEKDWDSIRPDRSRAVHAGMGLLRVTLLFGSAAVALALIVVPLLDNGGGRQGHGRDGNPFGLDMTSTGSIGGGSYTVRRSVLQPFPGSVCIIRADGRRSGDC